MTSAASLPEILDLDDSAEGIQEYYDAQGWTDGLPIVPPTPERVQAMYRYVDWKPEDLISVLAPRNGQATLGALAVNAVMAGCRPEYMPVIIAAVQAITEDPFDLNGVQATTHPCGVLVLVNGPLARELEINSGHNAMGPGWRANATIGRAMRLILLNIGGATPGEGDKSTQGSPVKYSFCFAEREEANPWGPLHVEHGYEADDSVVTVMACEGPHNINDSGRGKSAEEILHYAALAMRGAGSNHLLHGGGQPLVVWGPENAATIAADGYSKDDVKRYLWEHARTKLADLPLNRQKSAYVERWLEMGSDSVGIAEDPSRFEVVVVGGSGTQSSWIPTFGGNLTQTVMRRIERPDGTPYRSVRG